MAFDPNALIVPGKGTVLYADPETLPPDFQTVDPTDSTALDTSGWTALGHTSRENGVALTKEGGDPTVRGSWWEAALITTYADTNWAMTMNALQVDSPTLSIAFGGGTSDSTEGSYTVKSSITAQKKALYIIMIDGETRMGIYIPNASISIGDAPEIDPENFFEIQLAAQILSSTEGNRFQLFHPALKQVV